MKRNEKGQVLVLVALAIFVLLGLCGPRNRRGVHVYRSPRTPAECGRGALAGAFALNDGETGMILPVSPNSLRTPRPRPARGIRITRDKVAAAAAQSVAGDSVTVSFPLTSDPMRSVTSSERQPLFRADYRDGRTGDYRARRCGGLSRYRQKVNCIKPLGIPYPWTDTNGNGNTNPGRTDCTSRFPRRENVILLRAVTESVFTAMASLVCIGWGSVPLPGELTNLKSGPQPAGILSRRRASSYHPETSAGWNVTSGANDYQEFEHSCNGL